MLMQKNEHKSVILLLLVAAAMLLINLGSRELWSLETRWANVVLQMLQSHDYWHPLLKGEEYYDKPLLSYWIIILMSKMLGGFSAWALRLPSVLAALASVYFIYDIGKRIFDHQTGLIAGWLLVTTYYFIFWGRVASADMLNMAGMLAAIWWFFRAPEKTTFGNYVIFFQIMAFTSLCKGLLGVVLPGLVILPYIIMHQLLRKHLNINFFIALIPAIAVYCLPFYLSEVLSSATYHSDGLSLVIKENITRFFAPFDHKGAIYTYLIYLPVYTLPWTPLFLIAIVQSFQHWKKIAINRRWLVSTIMLLFFFFTLSGSRRSYYVLPIIPFAQLLAAILVREWVLIGKNKLVLLLQSSIVALAIFYLVFFGIALPWYYTGGGAVEFGQQVQQEATKQAPWYNWHVVMIDVDNKIPFYIQTSSPPIYIDSKKMVKNLSHQNNIFKALHLEALVPTRTIFISRAQYTDLLQQYLFDATLIESKPTYGEKLFSRKPTPAIAFIPQNLLR